MFSELTLSIDKENGGKLSYKKLINDAVLSSDAQQLVDAIDNTAIEVLIDAVNSYKAYPRGGGDKGKSFFGGAFLGAYVGGYNDDDGKFVATYVRAYQIINPIVLAAADNYLGTPGSLTLHEITEAYQGALLALKDQKNIPFATKADENNPNSYYNLAHKAATPQKATITLVPKADRIEIYVQQERSPVLPFLIGTYVVPNP